MALGYGTTSTHLAVWLEFEWWDLGYNGHNLDKLILRKALPSVM